MSGARSKPTVLRSHTPSSSTPTTPTRREGWWPSRARPWGAATSAWRERCLRAAEGGGEEGGGMAEGGRREEMAEQALVGLLFFRRLLLAVPALFIASPIEKLLSNSCHLNFQLHLQIRVGEHVDSTTVSKTSSPIRGIRIWVNTRRWTISRPLALWRWQSALLAIGWHLQIDIMVPTS